MGRAGGMGGTGEMGSGHPKRATGKDLGGESGCPAAPRAGSWAETGLKKINKIKKIIKILKNDVFQEREGFCGVGAERGQAAWHGVRGHAKVWGVCL